MNIFVTDPSPTISARHLPDKHIVKMPLESCQMLSIVASDKWGHGFGVLPKLDGAPYKTDKGAFRNHPCTIWAQTNFRWLIDHGLALCAEYTHRYNKVHSCQYTIECADIIFPDCPPPTSFTRAMPMNINMTQALTLLLLTKITLAANLGLHLIIFVTHPANRIGYPKL